MYDDKNTFHDPNNAVTRASYPVFSDQTVLSVKRSQDSLPSNDSQEISSIGVVPDPPPDPGEALSLGPKAALSSHKEAPPLQTVPALQAIIHVDGTDNCDMRPFFTDKSSNITYLWDSGSAITALPKSPGDSVKPNMRLKAANNTAIPCYGMKEIEVKIGRKTYKIEAAIADVSKPILGFDFIKKHKLNSEWVNEELTVYDRVAKIRDTLKFSAIPHQSCPSTKGIEVWTETCEESDLSCPVLESISFQIESVKALQSENEEELIKIEKKFQDLINEFPELLQENFKDKPNKQGIKHFIDTGTHPPTKAKTRKLMPGSPREIDGKKAWMELVDLKIVEPVDTSKPTNWASALHLQQKPSGGWRPCGDFRNLNMRTELDKYPLPLLRNFTSKLRDATVFSKVDMRLAFHHIDVDESCRHKTTTLTPWGAYQWRKLPMGLANSAQSYQRWMDSLLDGLENTFCYLDDILVWGKDERQHMATLRSLFERLQDAGLSLSLKKCKFGVSSVDFLGYKVDKTGILPLEKKVQAIQNYPAPTKQKELLAFLGCLNYFRPCLGPLKINGAWKNCAEILQPLYQIATDQLRTKN